MLVVRWDKWFRIVGKWSLAVSETVKNKIRQLYKFLKGANQLRFRPVRQLSDQPRVVRLADLPDHPATQLYRPVRVEQTQEVPDTLNMEHFVSEWL